MDITTLIGQSLLLFNVALVGLLVARLTPLDVTLSCIMTGFGFGLLLPLLALDTGIRASNIHDLVFYLLLPPLIFNAAWHIRPRLLRRWLGLVLSLAVVGLLLSTASIAGLTYIAIGHPSGFPWEAALLVGVMLAATDPLSVNERLQEAQAPEDLNTLVEGESLFNDATAIVLFTLVLQLAQPSAEPLAWHQVMALFVQVFFGGIIVGITAGLITAILVLVFQSSTITNFTLVLAAFSSFFIGEKLHVSGIITVLTMALVARACLRSHEQMFMTSVHDTWQWLGTALNALVLTLMGLVMLPSMFTERWLAILIAIAASLIARCIAIYSTTALSRRARREMPADWKPILVWGGLRGSIAIVLALSLPSDLDYWWTVQSMVLGTVLFSLLIQGSTFPWLLRRLLPRKPDT